YHLPDASAEDFSDRYFLCTLPGDKERKAEQPHTTDEDSGPCGNSQEMGRLSFIVIEGDDLLVQEVVFEGAIRIDALPRLLQLIERGGNTTGFHADGKLLFVAGNMAQVERLDGLPEGCLMKVGDHAGDGISFPMPVNQLPHGLIGTAK